MKATKYNPTSRTNSSIELEELQVGLIRYKDSGFECVIGVETEEINKIISGTGLTDNKQRRISRLHWSVSASRTPGNQVDLCPRDITIFKYVLEYLEEMGHIVP